MIYLFVVLGHSKILGKNLNCENGEFLIISSESAHSRTVLWITKNLQYQSHYDTVFYKIYANVYLCKNIYLDLCTELSINA